MSNTITTFPRAASAQHVGSTEDRTIISIPRKHYYHDLIAELCKQEGYLFPGNPTARLAASVARALVTERRHCPASFAECSTS